ncbi:TonB family protein [Comamonadaceae bacterium G21597-S1]|nr:TonB family protein [Comamonadaceae bacterium G21597-S1]
MMLKGRSVVAIAACVLALHAAALWALHAGLASRKPDVVVPVQMLARLVEPPRPIAPVPPPPVTQQATVPRPTPPAAKPRPVPARPKPVARTSAMPKPAPPTPTPPKPTPMPAPTPAPAPLPVVTEATTTPAVPVATAAHASGKAVAPGTAVDPAPAPAAATAIAAAAPARPAPAPIELPSSDAQYLQNPRPRYPPISVRLREQGTVLVDVLVSDQGLAREARVQTSSGFFRLDNAAVSTVLTWRFVPGKRAGVAQSMWFTVPITFAIQ